MPRLVVRRLARPAVLAALVLTACGDTGSTVDDGGGAESRTVVLDAVAAKLSAFDGADRDLENQQMLAFLQSRPEFTATGLSDTGTTWGRFADGTTLIIGNNLDVTQSTRQPRELVPAARSWPRSTRAGGIPHDLGVVLGTGLGSFWERFCEIIPEMFAEQNYDRVIADPTVDALKSLRDVSVLYLLAHGGAATLRNGEGPTYAVWTSTVRARDGSTDVRYRNDLQDGSLVYFMGAAFNLDAGGEPHPVIETHYAITPKFVTKHWTGKFSQNSLVFINACGSSGTAASQFKFAFMTAGASAYIGWTDKMILGDAVTSAAYLFDRLLGTNRDLSNAWSPTSGKESPPQRPFSYLAVVAEMGTRPRAGGSTMYDASLNPRTSITAKLEVLPFNMAFLQLAPSIESLSVNEQKDELTIAGFFGSTSKDALVTIGGSELKIKSWGGNQIVCELPRTGGAASGDVKVTINASAQHSNVVQLTEWLGTVKCIYEGNGSLRAEWIFKLHFRADVHSRRLQPHQTPFTTGANFLHALDSAGTYLFSGRYVSPDGLYTEDWTGSGSVPAFIKPPAGTSPPEVSNVLFEGGFDEDRNWNLTIRSLALKSNRIHSVLRDTLGNLVYDKTEDKDGAWFSMGDMNGNLTLATANAGFDIPGGTKTLVINADEQMTLEWTAMPARNPPAADAARGVR